ncbi:amidase [Leekyejoonella antrihumi]|uniref:Amidase n=1 Tax=Leekyejoonella antrihumi TaxID=1660198 RepID=A0A563DVZ8_9MICO|nr:amidase [Leekyejoonella antrihumi]TWP34450.1 amidase [Leekyejoonella antrihumi]
MALDTNLREALTDSLESFRADLSPDGPRTPQAPPDRGLRAASRLSSAHLRTPENSTLMRLCNALTRGELTAEELVRDLLTRADALDPQLHAYATRFDALALRAARRSDQQRRTGQVTRTLHGIPVAVKDVLSTQEGPTTANSGVSAVHLPAGEATAVRSLRAAGAIVLGKTTTMELASGMPDLHRPDQVPRNPWDTSRWTGGSSSGSAGGVAAQLFPAALGSDTAGSIRTPAALCGVTGFKPTHTPRLLTGCLPLSSSMDSVGPIAGSAIDCDVLLDALIPARPPGHESVSLDLKGTRVAVERSRFHAPGIDDDIQTAFQSALQTLTDQGVQVDEIVLPHYESLQVAARVIWTADAVARYGRYRAGLTEPTRDLLSVGEMTSGADYALAQQSRRWAERVFTDLLTPYVALLSPTRTCLAPEVTDATIDWQMSAHNHTAIWNLVGFPAVSVPMGLSATGLPIGLQIVGVRGADRQTLAVAAHFQSMTSWHRARPPVSYHPSPAREHA